MTALMIATAVLTAAAVVAAGYLLTVLAGIEPDPAGAEGARRQALRTTSLAYRVFEPSVRALAEFYGRSAPTAVARLGHRLEVLGVEFWRPEELVAVRQVQAAGIGLAAAGLAGALFGPSVGLAAGLLLALLVPYLLLKSYGTRATAHVAAVRGRLPFALDLMALMLEAGAGTLQECLSRAGEEHAGQPLGAEIRRTLTGVDKGMSAADMLKAMDRRLADPDVKDLVLTVTTAEERGIPLKDALRGLAERMRQRKVQWMEKSAEQAKVKITGPAMVTMAACMLVVVAPLLLHAFNSAPKF